MVLWHWIVIGIVAIVVISALSVTLFVTQTENSQARQAEKLLGAQQHEAVSETTSAVVFFSRSGNTALASHHVADQLGARIFRLEAPDYKLGIIGWISALIDARNHQATVKPGEIDLSPYDTIYLGSPIWLYSPAPPIWEFARLHRFDAKRVILFNTFNSKFEQSFIDEFRDLVLTNGAVSFHHRFVKRGRMGQQLSTKEMLREIDARWKLFDQKANQQGK
jgi:flavodoxin